MLPLILSFSSLFFCPFILTVSSPWTGLHLRYRIQNTKRSNQPARVIKILPRHCFSYPNGTMNIKVSVQNIGLATCLNMPSFKCHDMEWVYYCFWKDDSFSLKSLFSFLFLQPFFFQDLALYFLGDCFLNASSFLFFF